MTSKKFPLCYSCKFQKTETRSFYTKESRTPSSIHIQRECEKDPSRDCYKRTVCKDYEEAVYEPTDEEVEGFKRAVKNIRNCGICNRIMFTKEAEPICENCKIILEEDY